MELKERQLREKNRLLFGLALLVIAAMLLISVCSLGTRGTIIRIPVQIAALLVVGLTYVKFKNTYVYTQICMYSFVVAYAVTLLTNDYMYVYGFMFPIALSVVLYIDSRLAVKGAVVAIATNIIYLLVYFISGDGQHTMQAFAQTFFAVISCTVMILVVRVLDRHNKQNMQDLLNSTDEQTKIAREIVKMSEILEDKVDNANQVSRALTDSIETNHNSVTEIAASVKLTAESIEQQTMMTSDIQENLEGARVKAEQMKLSSEITKKEVDEGAKLLESLKEQADETARINRSTRETTGELNDCIEEVENIIGTILSISDQTNLLALNASIEAARAGEAGKGFAVVADEIRKLSEETKASTEKITEIIGRLTKDVAKASENMEVSIDSSEKQNVMIEDTGDKFTAILKEMEDLYENTISISSDVNEIVAANTQIIDSITNLSATSQEVAASSESSISVSDNSVNAVGDMNKVLEEVFEISENMKQLVKGNV